MPESIFVTGIGTNVGKTLVSAILVEKLKADYWKPIQSGDLANSDTMKVKSLVSNPLSVFHPESYKLTQPFSPHKSAAIDGISIDIEKFILPETSNSLIVEGAGGIMVPLNERHLVIDLIKKLGLQAVVVSQNYLGSINHTLLTVFALKQYEIPIKGIIFNGPKDFYSKEYILSASKVDHLGHIPEIAVVNKKTIAEAGNYISF